MGVVGRMRVPRGGWADKKEFEVGVGRGVGFGGHKAIVMIVCYFLLIVAPMKPFSACNKD